MWVKFRIDIDCIKESIDVLSWFKERGTKLSLVVHEKPGNFHYHGLIDCKYTLRTLRNHIKVILDDEGNRAYSFGDVPEPDKYLSYIIYREGQPNRIIELDDTYDLEHLKHISETRTSKNSSRTGIGKLESTYQTLREEITEYESMKILINKIVMHYQKTQQIIHKANIYLLAQTLYLHLTGDVDNITKSILNSIDADNLKQIHNQEEIVEYRRRGRQMETSERSED